MKFAYSNAQMRSFGRRETERSASLSVLMKRAGKALAEAVKNAIGRFGQRDIVFVCGGGNSGGAGFCAAELLRSENYDVTVLCLAEELSPACNGEKESYKGEIIGRIPRRIYGIAVDCLFGIGLARSLGGVNADLVSFLNACRYIIACDLPAGLTEGGIALPLCVKADETVCLGQLKTALILSDGADVAGEISVADIGISAEGGVEVWEDGDVGKYFPKKKSNSNKGDYGSAAILAGYGAPGAPIMAAAAALKSGAGYTGLWFPPSKNRETDELRRTAVTAAYPACIFDFYKGGPLFAQAVAFGMGAGVGLPQREMLEDLLSSYACGTLILDADALNTLSHYGVGLLRKKKCPVIVTPHPKEFSRLTGRSTEELLKDPVEAAKAFSEEYGVTVVFKNNRTVIAEGDRVAVNPTGSPVLAKGGSGDVLAGFLAGTVARGVPPFEAAVVSSYLLGRAGELAAADMNEYSPDATDIVRYLSGAIRSVMQFPQTRSPARARRSQAEHIPR